MGCFSYICKKSLKPVSTNDAVRLYLLKQGKVIEEMRGHYDSYGKVFNGIEADSFEWETDWNVMVNLHFGQDESSGMAAILEFYFDGEIPTTRSDDDPNQGWGKKNGKRRKIKEPVHLSKQYKRDIILKELGIK